MRDKEFLNIQSALRAATSAPENAPTALVRRTARKCEAVLAGREAERLLKQEAGLPTEEIYDLAAASVLGQLALGKGLPEGRDVSEMRHQLSSSAWFRSRFDGTAEAALQCLRNGTLFRSGTEPANAVEAKAQQKEGLTRHQAPAAKGGA